MPMTIDNLRVDHRVTIRQDFTDATGITMRPGDTGIIRALAADSARSEMYVDIEQGAKTMRLTFRLRPQTGPRLGTFAQYFELGEDVSIPRVILAYQDHAKREMITPPLEPTSAPLNTDAWTRAALDLDGPDKLDDVEREMRAAIPYIGVGASIAELYAQRMRAFQRVGNEQRAIVAFRNAVDWMATQASWATSGGEGTALSYERDQFQKALALEFGYDPTQP